MPTKFQKTNPKFQETNLKSKKPVRTRPICPKFAFESGLYKYDIQIFASLCLCG